MGRLDKALERIKSRELEKSAVVGQSSVARKRKTISARSEPDNSLFEKARSVRLNRDFLSRNRIITDDMEPSVITSYKMLRTRILQRMRANGWQSLAVTSATQGDGKTISAINLAISLAGDVNHSVVLVDLDLRHSSISNYLGLDGNHGVSDCLHNAGLLKKAFIRPDIERLTVLPNFNVVTQSSELLSSPDMHDLALTLVSDPKRIVVYDMPPLLSADDMLAFEPCTDAILFVVAEGKTTRTDVVKARELIENFNVIGTVLNHSDERTASYY